MIPAGACTSDLQEEPRGVPTATRIRARVGALYGLIAIGYTMVYGIVQLINFAHGEIFMTGGMGALLVYAWLLPSGTPLAVALPLMLLGGMLTSTIIAIGAERLAYRPLRTARRGWPR